MIGKWWRKRLRRADMEILWPSCVRQAKDLDHAKAALAVHIFNDRAWTKDYTHEELVVLIDELKPEAHQ